MAPRRITRRTVVTLALAGVALALGVGGCASADQGATWHPGTTQAAGGQGGGMTAAHTVGAGRTGTGRPPGPGPAPTRSGSATPAPGTSGSPGTPGGTPTGTGPAGSLTTTGTSAVALTFDDGPGPYTAPILDLLARYHVKATFCLIGRQVHAYADVVRRMVAEGHTLCNHTWDHDEQLRTRTDEEITDELQRTNDAIHAAVPGAKIRYFRNPGGNFGPNTVAVAARLGMVSLMWNVDPRDWAHPGVQEIVNNVNTHTGPGSIVLSHDGGGDRSDTLAAYQTLLPGLTSRFTLVAMPVS